MALPDGHAGNRVGNRTLRDDEDDHPHGRVNLEHGIIASCNAYFSQLGYIGVGATDLLQTSDLLGIKVAEPNTVERLQLALPDASYGQGEVISDPFQIARVAALIANGGAMNYGRWVSDDVNLRAQGSQNILLISHANLLAGYMRGVVTNGTARVLNSSQIPIAGKTGTAQVGGNLPSHSWFVGFAPYSSNRKIAFAVLIENSGYGARFAAPASGEIVRAARDLNIIGQ